MGQQLVEGFKVDDVAEIRIVEPKATVTLVRGERGWTVKERGDFPADVEPIRDLLLKLQELKVVQAEGVSDAVKPRLQLAAPDAGAKPEETGTLVELKSRDGKTVATLVLGKKTRQGHEDRRHSRRYSERSLRLGRGRPAAGQRRERAVLQRAREARAVADEGALARRAPEVDQSRSRRTGRRQWALSKESEDGAWKLAGPGPLDLQKAQDASSALYALQIADAAPGVSDADAGLDKPTTIRAETFDGWTYELQIGKPPPDNRYYVRSSVTGVVPEKRARPGDEKAEDKEKADKAFAERKELLDREARARAGGRRADGARRETRDRARCCATATALIKVDKPKDPKAKDAKAKKK